MDKYNRMMQLNYHIQEQFKKKLKEIKRSILIIIKNRQLKINNILCKNFQIT